MRPEQSSARPATGPVTPTPGPRRRTWRLVVLVLLGVLGVACAGLYVYLGSAAVAAQVAAQLKQLLGVEVTVGSARIGLLGASTAQDVTVQERASQAALVRIQQAKLDLTLLGAIRSALPGSVDLDGAEVRLRFAADGKLLTALPQLQGGGPPVPPVRVRNGSVVLDQEGRAPLRLSGAELTLAPAADGLTIDGTITDPEWGRWTVAMRLEAVAQLFTLRLHKKSADLDMTLLRQLPFVAESVWKAVQIAGTSDVDFTLRVPFGQKVSYRVLLDVARAEVYVPVIELRVADVVGKAIIEDSLVLLDRLKGKVAAGKLGVSAALDFRQPPAQLKFDVDAAEVAVEKLPPSWKLPPALRGLVDLKAILLVVLAPDGVRTSGEGSGDIHNARFGDLEFRKAPLRLVADGKRFRLLPKLPGFTWPFPGVLLPGEGRVIGAAFQPEKPFDPVAGFRYGTRELGRLTTRGIDTVWRGIETVTRPRRPDEPIPYLEAETGLDGVELADLVRQAGLTLPFSIGGKVSVRIRIGIPLEAGAGLRAYRVFGRFGVVGLRLADARIAAGVAAVRFADGVLTLGSVAGLALTPIPGERPLPLEPLAVAGPAYLLAAGAAPFHGAGRVRIEPLGNLEASLGVADVPLDRFMAGLTEGAITPTGKLAGEVTVQVPVTKLASLEAWSVRGAVRVPTLHSAGVRFANVTIEPRLSNGSLVIPSVSGLVQGAALTGSGRIGLAAPYPVEATVRLARAEVAAFPVPADVQGQLDLTLTVAGSLRAGITLAGRLQGDRLTLAGYPLVQPAASWRIADGRLHLDRVTATFARGTVSGSGTLPLTARQTGKLALQANSLFLGEFARQLPGLPLRVAGLVDGTLALELGALPADGERPVALTLDLTAPRLLVQNLALHRTTTRLTYDGSVAQVALHGETLGGTGDITGTFRLRGEDAPSWEAEANIQGLRLDQLDQELGGNLGLQALRGRIDLTFRASKPADERPPAGRGRLILRGLTWQGEDTAQDMRASLLLDGPRLRIREVETRLAGGTFRLALGLNFQQLERSWFRLTLASGNLARLLGPLFEPQQDSGSVRVQRADTPSDRLYDGPVEVTLRGNLGRDWRGSGTVTLTRGRVAGAEVEELRLPFLFTWSPFLGSGQVTIEDSTGRLGRGHVRGGLVAQWSDNGRSLRVAGGIRFHEVELRSVFPTWGLNTLAGRVAGRLDFSGENMVTLDDLRATIEASLSRTQALQAPVLRALPQFLKTVRGDLAFDTGYLKASLARSVFRVHTLYLNSEAVRLSLAGTMTTGGRLDLEAIALTGLDVLVGTGPVAALVGRVPRNAPLTAQTLGELTRLLTDRVIHLHLGGNARSPSVKVEPLKTLRDEVTRFLIGGGMPTPQ